MGPHLIDPVTHPYTDKKVFDGPEKKSQSIQFNQLSRPLEDIVIIKKIQIKKTVNEPLPTIYGVDTNTLTVKLGNQQVKTNYTKLWNNNPCNNR